MKNLRLYMIRIFILPILIQAAQCPVAPDGKDSNHGTTAAPFATIRKVADLAKAGDVVVIAPGIYREYIVSRHSGTPNFSIIVRA